MHWLVCSFVYSLIKDPLTNFFTSNTFFSPLSWSWRRSGLHLNWQNLKISFSPLLLTSSAIFLPILAASAWLVITLWISLPGPDPGLLNILLKKKKRQNYTSSSQLLTWTPPYKCQTFSSHFQLTLTLCHPCWSRSGRTPYLRFPQSCPHPPSSRWWSACGSCRSGTRSPWSKDSETVSTLTPTSQTSRL